MAYVTIEADIDQGRIIPREPGKLPKTGKALVTFVEASQPEPDWEVIMRLAGTMKSKADGLAVESAARAEWNEREGSGNDDR